MKKILIAALACLFITGCSSSTEDKDKDSNTPTQEIYDNESFIPKDFDNDYGMNEEIKYLSTFDNNYNATCRIRANYGKNDTTRTDQASGFIYKKDGNKYYVVTTASRVAYKKVIKSEVEFDFNGVFEFRFNDGRKYRGNPVGYYKDFDVAVFSIETNDFLPVGIMGKSDDLRIGQKVGAIGTPDVDQDLFNTYVEGVVAGLNRKTKSYFQSSVISVFSGFQFDAPTNNGMQGGPVLNDKNEIVGIISNKQVDDNIYESLSFGIAIDDLDNIIDHLIKDKTFEKILLGFTGGSIDFLNKAQWASDLGIYSGIYVVEVLKDGKAYEAGLKEDAVIVAVKTMDGKTININSMEEFQSQLVRLNHGDNITLCVRYPKTTENEEINIVL